MNASRRPLSITILAWVYIGVGTMGFVYHFREFLARTVFHYDAVWIEALELVAILCGVFLLRGRNWARWVALGWIALHVIVSAFHPFREFAMHFLICAAIAWILFRAEAARYFRGPRIETA